MESVSQPVSQSVSQSINQSASQSISQSDDQHCSALKKSYHCWYRKHKNVAIRAKAVNNLMGIQSNNKLSPWYRIFLGKLTGKQLVLWKAHVHCNNETSQRWILSRTPLIQSPPLHPICARLTD